MGRGQRDRLIGSAHKVHGALALDKVAGAGIVGPVAGEVDHAIGRAGCAIAEIEDRAASGCIVGEVAKDREHFGRAARGIDAVTCAAGAGDVVALAVLAGLYHDVIQAARGKGHIGGGGRHESVVPVAGIEPIGIHHAIPQACRTWETVGGSGGGEGHVVEVKNLV